MDSELFEIHPSDRDAIRMLADFIPDRVFDAHLHMHCDGTVPHTSPAVFRPGAGTPEQYRKDMGAFFPHVKTLRLNMMPMPDTAMNDPAAGLREAANEHIIRLTETHAEHVGAVYVLPGDSEEVIGRWFTHPGIRAIKCYCYGSGAQNMNACAIGDFLPEAAWVVSAQTRCPIILHMMRPASLSDPDNFSYIRTMSKRYPDARLVLAHCARAFAAWTVIDKIRELEDCGNIWFDLSAVCESAPMAACIMAYAGKRTVWGSDYPICMHRGRAISLSTGFLWLIDDDLKALSPQGQQPCLVAAENLLAFRQACILLGLDRTQIEDLFYNNAMELFALNSQQVK